MRRVVLGKSGLQVSAVGFGGIPIMRLSMDDAVRTVRAALDLGVTFIDTAASYADSQEKIGRAIQGYRDRLVLATKSGAKDREAMLADIDTARRDLAVDRIDLYQLHGVSSPEAWEKIRAPGGALEALLEARDNGWVDHLGFTSHNVDVALELAEDPRFETVQFPFNMVTHEPADRLIPKARNAGLGFIVMKPMCGGQFDDAALAFKFLNGYPDLVPIPGVERPEEIREIVAIVESRAVLEGAERQRAERVAAELGKLFCRRCGYCEPCPQGVPVTTAMIFDSFAKRMPRDHLVAGPAKRVAEKVPECVECGECEEKCPYHLPIMETIKASLRKARAALGR